MFSFFRLRRPSWLALVASVWLGMSSGALAVDKPIAPGRYFLNIQGASRYLDVYSANPAAGTHIQVWDRVGGPNQIWQVIKAPEKGFYYLRSDMGRYLDVRGGSAAADTPVQIWDFTGTDAQKWQFIEASGRVQLRSRLGTYLRVQAAPTSNGVRVVAGALAPGRVTWNFQPAEVIPDSYLLKNTQSSRYLDVYGANPAAGTHAQIWDRVGGLNQRWELIPSDEAGYFFVKSEMGRYLDVQWGRSAPGTLVHIWDFNGGSAQKWALATLSDGQVTLRSRLGTYLSVRGTGTANGTRVETASTATANTARWRLEPVQRPRALHGWADLHTHPMSHLGFGKKLMHGAPDAGSIVPAGTRDCNPADFRAASVEQALGHCNSTHGGWGVDNGCGDYIRAAVLSKGVDRDFIHTTDNLHGDHEHGGYPELAFWPDQSSVIHQQMWWEWIKRAYQGGLRVMVALAVNNELLGTVINGDGPLDDRGSADLQIEELTTFVSRHNDFMDVALSAADVRRIVEAGKLAVVLGVEVDNLGGFGRSAPTIAQVRSELQRLHGKGVRYVFPIHVTDNVFGGAAVYEDLFNYANKHATGAPFDVMTAGDPLISFRLSPGEWWIGPLLAALGPLPYPPGWNLFECPTGTVSCWERFRRISGILSPDPRTAAYASIPGGHVNRRSLTVIGELAIAEMMRMGMLVDLDHMSERSMTRAIEIAEWISPGGYPVMMGHNGIRGARASERSVSSALAVRAARLGGMLGVGTADTTPAHFIEQYDLALDVMGRRVAGLGSDANGMEKLPRQSPNLDSDVFYRGFSRARTGNRTWDYTREGVAHYGLMWDFLRDVERQPDGPAVVGNLFSSAEYFAQTWERAERAARAAAPR